MLDRKYHHSDNVSSIKVLLNVGVNTDTVLSYIYLYKIGYEMQERAMEFIEFFGLMDISNVYFSIIINFLYCIFLLNSVQPKVNFIFSGALLILQHPLVCLTFLLVLVLR